MHSKQEDTNTYTQSFIARQPVFDVGLKAWGYALLYRDSLTADHAVMADPDQATLQVAMQTCLGEVQTKGQSRFMVNFTPQAILDMVPQALPPGVTVVRTRADSLRDPRVRTQLAVLKEQKYLVALDDFESSGLAPGNIGLADIISIDMIGKTREDIARITKPAREKGVKVLGQRVEDHQTLQLGREAGVELFQGFFFQKPETLTSRVLTSTQTSRLAILRLLEQPEPDLTSMARAIQKDVSISYRLLSFLNSPYFGLRYKVTSIKQALLLAGWTQMRNWLRLVVMADLNPQNKPSELTFHSVQRGRFLETVAAAAARHRGSADRLFLLGLFSLLDSMFDMPMAAIVEKLPLDEEIKEALCRKPTGLGPWLGLTESFERADWDSLSGRIQELALDPVDTATRYTQSLQWANSFYRYLG